MCFSFTVNLLLLIFFYVFLGIHFFRVLQQIFNDWIARLGPKGKILYYKVEMLNQKNAWDLISIGQYGIWKFRKLGKNNAQNYISYKTVLMEAGQKILVKHLPNNIRNTLWKFGLEMFCWPLDICRSVFSTFLVPRPYYHAEWEYFFNFLI